MCQFSDKFYTAVSTLSGDGPIKERLVAAYGDNLDLIAEEDVPDIIQPRFDLLHTKMHATKPSGNENPVLAAVRKMSAPEAAACASHIVAMFSELVRVKTTGERLRPLRHEPAQRDIDAGRDRASLN
jgi:hypothetical protein